MPIVLAVVVAGLAAASFRLRSLTATLLAAYVVLVTDAALVTWVLSPFDAVTMTGLVVAEGVLLVAAVVVWWLRGRPGIPRASLRAITADPVTLALVAVAAVALAYELVLVLTAPATNWDSLTYHLSRVAAWHQAQGVHWIANAPTGRMNEFQPLAEQEILFLFVASGSTALFALPQFVAELAIVVAVYGCARRLGYGVRACVGAAAVLATLSLVALESTTAQNDLVAASFPVAAAFFLLGGGAVEVWLAGIAVSLGAGVKLTSALTLPVLLWLAWMRGRRTLVHLAGGAALGMLLASAWGFVLNLAHTGHLFGHGQGRVENTRSFSVGGTVRTGAHFFYRLVDLGPMPHWLVIVLAAAGIVVGVAAALYTRRAPAALAGLPFLAPAIAAAVLHVLDGYDPVSVARSANEDFSGFGPLGTLFLFAAPLVVLATRRSDRRLIAVALALPIFILLLALNAKYNIWTTRFLVVPVVLTAPLFAELLRSRLVTAAVAAVAAIAVALTLVHDGNKPLNGDAGRPWSLSQVEAFREFSAEPTGRILAGAVAAYERAVPERACVGAVLGLDEPAYPLWGNELRRRVYFLPSLDALQTAIRDSLAYVVISTGANRPVADQFSGANWAVKPLGQFWLLATAPPSHRGSVCR